MFSLNPNLADFWRTQKPYKLLKGGRFSSKTHDAAGMAAFLARNYSLRFMCVRQFQNRISDSVYTVVKEKIEEANWQDEFDIGVSSIKHKTTGSEFLFYGIARNLSDIKGTEGVDVLWIEEAEGLTEDQWEVLDPTLRKEDAEIWLLWNPRLVTDFVQSRLPELLGDACIIRHINYDENPFLSDSAREKAERLKAADPDSYAHIYLGVPRQANDAAIIKPEWIEAAVDAHIKIGIDMTGGRVVGYDVADAGDDKNATVTMDGCIAIGVDEWAASEDQLKESAMRAWAQVGASGRLVYDSIGVGAHVGSTLADIEGAANRYRKFNAAAGVVRPSEEYAENVKNSEKFENLKSQAWRSVADRFLTTYNAVVKGLEAQPQDMISIAADVPHIERLKTELATPGLSYSKRALEIVESKDQLAKRGIKSPNLADAFIMAASWHLADEGGAAAGLLLPRRQRRR